MKKRATKSFIIVDPKLQCLEGHEFGYDTMLASAIHELLTGYDVRVYSARTFPFADRFVTPCFSPIGTNAKFPAQTGGDDACSSNPILPERTESPALAPYVMPSSQTTARQTPGPAVLANCARLRRIMASRAGEYTESHFLFQHGDRTTLQMVGFLEKFFPPNTGDVTLHIIFRDPPEFVFGDVATIRAVLSSVMAGAAGRFGIRLYTDTEQLTKAYAGLFDSNVGITTLPLPCLTPFLPAKGIATRHDSAIKSTIKIGMLGSPRVEKGILLAPVLYNLLPNRLVNGTRLELRVQMDDQSPDPRVRSLVQWVHGLTHEEERPLLTRLRNNLDEGEYAGNMAEIDISLLLYVSPRYLFSSAGVLIDSITFGIPVVTFSGTWMATVLEEARAMGFVIGMAVDRVEDVPRAVETIALDLSAFKENAKKYHARRALRHTPLALARTILAYG